MNIQLKEENKEIAYIYMITDEDGCVKIGISRDPNKRLKQLQTGHASKLSLYHTEEFNCTRNHLLKIEKLLHREISNSHKKANGEWFKISGPELESTKLIVIFFRIRYEDDTTYFIYR